MAPENGPRDVLNIPTELPSEFPLDQSVELPYPPHWSTDIHETRTRVVSTMPRRILVVLVVSLGLGLLAAPAAADPSPAGDGAPDSASSESTAAAEDSDAEMSEKEAAIRELLEITGTPEIGLQIAERILQRMKETHPDVPEKFWKEFEAELDRQTFIDMIVPVYREHFTKKEVEKLIEFYRTDVGQKYVEKLPTLTKESMEAGRRWGQRIGQRIVEQLQQRGYR